MIAGFLALLACQLAGETLTRELALPVPGPVLGMVLLFLLLELGTARAVFDRARVGAGALAAVAAALLANLGLLFVPAGAGVVENLDLLTTNAAGFGTVLVVSTVLTLLATVGAFLLVQRWAATRRDRTPPA